MLSFLLKDFRAQAKMEKITKFRNLWAGGGLEKMSKLEFF